MLVINRLRQSAPVTLHSPLSDIQRLDREAQERNDHVSPVKDFASLSEIFWAIGIDFSGKQASCLWHVSNTASTGTMPVLKIEYETVQGDRVIDDLTGSAIYELCISTC